MPWIAVNRTANRRRSLRPWVAGLVVFTTLPLLLLTAIIAWRGERAAQDRVAADRVALARAAALTVSSWVDTQIAAAQVLAPTPDVSDPFTRPDLPGFLALALANHPDWEDVDLFGPQGWNIASAAREPETVNIADRPHFQQVLSADRPVLSPVTVSPRTGSPIVALAIPARFATGANGALVVTLLTQKLNELLGELGQASTIQIVLLDGEGTAFAHAGGDSVVPLASWRGREDADAVLAGESGVRHVVDDDGRDTLAAHAPVPKVGWGVLALQPESVAFGPVRQQLLRQLAALGLAAVLTGAIGWYLGHRLSASYDRELKALARAEEAGRQRDQFLAAASHDLKTPLTTIKALAQLLERRASRDTLPDVQGFSEGLASIDAATNKMIAQIDELMDAVRLQTDRSLDLDYHPTDLLQLVRNVSAELQKALDRHHIRIEAAASELVGNWDSRRLERVIGNLLNNAVKYSPAGGEVVVTLTREETSAGDWAVLVVRDQGIGIPAADLPHVFEPFHRGRNVVGKVAGTGIGLAGVRQIVEQHGGTITAQSQEGAGSAFCVRLPLAREGPADVSAAPSVAPRSSAPP